MAAIRSESTAQPIHGKGYYLGLAFMGILYVVAGLNHFRNPQMYLAIMPPYIPSPAVMVAFTGVAEILGGIGLLIPNGFVFPRTRAAAAWGIVALLVCIWPVHIEMCRHPERFALIPLWLLWSRLVLQLPLIAWAWYYSRR